MKTCHRTCKCGAQFEASHHRSLYCPGCVEKRQEEKEARFNARRKDTCVDCSNEFTPRNVNVERCATCSKVFWNNKLEEQRRERAKLPSNDFKIWFESQSIEEQRGVLAGLRIVACLLGLTLGEGAPVQEVNPEAVPADNQADIDAAFFALIVGVL